MYHVVDHSKNSGSVAYYQLIKCRAVTSLALFYQFQFGDIGLSHRRFRLHNWTEGRRFNSFNPESLRAEAPAPLAAIFPDERNNPVAHLEKSLQKNRILGGRDPFLAQERGGRVHRKGDRF